MSKESLVSRHKREGTLAFSMLFEALSHLCGASHLQCEGTLKSDALHKANQTLESHFLEPAYERLKQTGLFPESIKRYCFQGNIVTPDNEFHEETISYISLFRFGKAYQLPPLAAGLNLQVDGEVYWYYFLHERNSVYTVHYKRKVASLVRSITLHPGSPGLRR